MLKNLHIENIAVIKATDLTLQAGLNVLTGETGAGKSIVIDAIHAALGERTSRERIRAGCDEATVCAVFGDFSAPVKQRLSEAGVTPDEQGELMLQRTLRADGRGTAFLNGRPVTAGLLREIGRYLINIHGQHDNQALLDPETHRLFLDRLADNADRRDAYYTVFREVNAIRRDLRALEADEDEKERRVSLLRYQIDELTAAQITPGEVAALTEKAAQFRNYEKLTLHLRAVREALLGGETDDGAVARAESAAGELQAANAAALQSDAEKLVELSLELQAVAEHADRFLSDLAFSPEALEQTEARFDLLRRLMQKYGDSEEKMLAFLADAQAQLQQIDSSQERLRALEADLERAEERLIERGAALTESRKRAADRLCREVCDVLRELDMPQVAFVVQLDPGRYTKHGCDTVEFLISANPGSPPRPLAKIASGGELSRIMLAIQSALAGRDEVDTLIFDEIDTGISGRAAQKVGRQLARVSRLRQVVCVTHLAQIAALADRHLLIEKSVADSNTYTNVSVLDEAGRVREIARIMAGAAPSETVLRSAKELLDRRNDHDFI